MGCPTIARQPLGAAALSPQRQMMSQTGMPKMKATTSLPHLQQDQGVAAMQFAVSGKQFGKGLKLPPTRTLNKSGSEGNVLAAMSMTFHASRTGGFRTTAGSWGVGPPKTGVWKAALPKGVHEKQHVFEPKPQPVTQFRRFFERGDLPISIKHGALLGVSWKVPPEKLDYVYNLPLFFEGLLERTEPFAGAAYQGLQELIDAAAEAKPSKLAPCMPSVIVPLKKCLNTKDNAVMCRAINMLQRMLRVDPAVGEVLVPYYRQILPTFALFRGHNKNLGDGIDYAQRKRENMGDLVAETLELMERTGGQDAFINIKYMIPTYESHG